MQIAGAAEAHQVAGMSFSKERLEQRRQTLGASEIAAVVGLNPHRSALDVYFEKVGVAVPFQGNEFTEWGLRLEDKIADAYAERMKVTLVRSDTVISATDDWMSATPDRIVSHPDPEVGIYGLECKNKGARQAVKFGESGTDFIPNDIAAQCHWSMMVTGLRMWDVAVLFGGNEFRAFRLHYDAEIAAAFQEQGYDFWHNRVLKGIEPDIDGSEAWSQHIKSKFSRYSEELREASPAEAGLIKDLRKTREMIKRFETDELLIVNRLKDAIGETAGIVSLAGRVTWKRPKPSRTVDYEAIAMTMIAPLPAHEREGILTAHTTLKEASRRFLPTFPKDG
jgi:putative phage-type endonuclease